MENEKLLNSIKESIESGQEIPYYIASISNVSRIDDIEKLRKEAVTAFKIPTSSVISQDIFPQLFDANKGDFVYFNEEGQLRHISQNNFFLYNQIPPRDLQELYQNAIDALEIKEKTPDDLLTEAIRKNNFLAAPIPENELKLYQEALSHIGISSAVVQNHLVVSKDDDEMARAAIMTIRQMSDREKEELMKDRASFEEKYAEELKKIEEQNKTMLAEQRVVEQRKPLPKKLKPKVVEKETKAVEDLSPEKIEEAIHNDQINDIGKANNQHEEKLAREAESRNDPTVLDNQFGHYEVNPDTMLSDTELDRLNKERGNEIDDDEPDPYSERTLFY